MLMLTTKIMNRKFLVQLSAPLLVLLFTVNGCVTASRGFPPIEGIANFDKVDSHLYRGAQPNSHGLQHLHNLGVRTIINLRGASNSWAAEEDVADDLDMEYFNIPMSSFFRPSKKTVLTILSIIEKSPSPVFVHCKHGCDRTGTIIACYRIKKEGWKSGKALNEARIFGMYRLEILMKSFVRDFERQVKTGLK